jgi:cephalosporin-C deacetylase-like acetyl esterase
MRIVSLFLASLCLLSAARAKDPVPVQVIVRTDRPEALYACGEQARFTVTVVDSGKKLEQGNAIVTVTRDGGEVLGKTALDLAAKGGATITANLDTPGFVRVEAVYRKGKANYTGLAGAGFDPEKIEATTVNPKDFDDFWATARAQLAEIPYDVQLTKLENKSSVNVDCYAVNFANIDGTRAYGFLAVPKGRPGPFPAYITVPGAGPGPFGPSATWAAKGCLSLTMSVHAYDCNTGKDAINQAYKELNAKGTYSHIGKPDRRAFYFYRAILGVDRAITWLSSRPDWDGTHMVIDGSSQGGAFSLIMAGLNERITAAAANVPALCEHAAFLAKRQPGWPNLTGNLKGKERDDVLAMSAYYDTVNFARRIKCPVIVSAGFIDRTCPPSTVYAAYNQIQSQKRIFNDPLAGHQWNVGEFRSFQPKWLAGRLGIGPACDPGE